MAVHGLVATSVIEENAAIKKRIGEETANLNKDGETLLLVGCSTGIVVAHELLCHETSRF